jgi:uncharacterized peroxidase-related enzyme
MSATFTPIAPTVPPMFLPEVEANPQPSGYLKLIERAREEGKENWQIWNLFAFLPKMTIHMGRFTHALMHEPGPISPAMRELIATYTSYLNDCEFCMRSHAAVTSYLMPRETVEAVLHDLETAPISEAEKALLRFTRKVTLDAGHTTEADMAPLREARWDDAAIYYAITVAALFNFYNRWVSATGVHAVSEEGHRAHASVIAERGYSRG